MARDPASRLVLCEPLNYAALLWVLQRAWLALTDSGGIQEEAIAVKVPVLVLRETTERPELLDAGGGILTCTDPDSIFAQLDALLCDEVRNTRMRQDRNTSGDRK